MTNILNTFMKQYGLKKQGCKFCIYDLYDKKFSKANEHIYCFYERKKSLTKKIFCHEECFEKNIGKCFSPNGKTDSICFECRMVPDQKNHFIVDKIEVIRMSGISTSVKSYFYYCVNCWENKAGPDFFL